jgi:hypothetical protein
MTASVILGALASVLLLPLIVTALRQRALVTMAVRNIGRRRGEAALVVGGALKLAGWRAVGGRHGRQPARRGLPAPPRWARRCRVAACGPSSSGSGPRGR